MTYLKQIQALESRAFNRGGLKQITIDWLQNTEIQLNRSDTEEPITRDELGSLCHRISILLDVFDPAKTVDIAALISLRAILEKWRDEVEFINRTLGIPLHLG